MNKTNHTKTDMDGEDIFEIDACCPSPTCHENDLIVQPVGKDSAKVVLSCESPQCDYSRRHHWREIISLEDVTVEFLKGQRRFERAQQAGDEEAADRIAEEMLRLSKQEKLLDRFRGE